MRFVASLLLIPVLLAACAEPPTRSVDPFEKEVQALFDQKYIDPLTRYLEKYAKDPTRAGDLARVRTERDRRCGEIAERYAARAVTAANLSRLRRGYGYSCPKVVDEFAARLAETEKSRKAAKIGAAEPEPAVESEATEIEPVAEPEAIETEPTSEAEAPEATPEPIEQARSPVDAEAAENCYLLFGIKSYREAQTACTLPAEQGDARAQYNLGVVSETLSDDAAAVKWTRLAVAQDLPEAALQLGLLYRRGTGVKQDDDAALKWFRQAAEQGVAEAQYQVGLAYFRGEGADPDLGEARRWFERAAEQGHAAAQAQLGEMYALGRGTEVDGKRAESWLKRASAQGVSDAQYRLGVLYAEGTLVPTDETEAYVWLSLAALAGNREAAVRRDRLAQTLAPARIDEAQQKIRRIIEQHR